MQIKSKASFCKYSINYKTVRMKTTFKQVLNISLHFDRIVREDRQRAKVNRPDSYRGLRLFLKILFLLV